ncbi:MAG: M3 family oligoendopeptidase [Thaumarchaeota archaeon]|nr:M3 family oligoendopeptidase [Nitrososphaerota archaeon]
MVFDYTKLPREFPRKFVPAGMAFTWEELSRQFQSLNERDLRTRDDLEGWMADEDELNAVIYERKTLAFVNNTRQTDDAEYRQAYLSYIRDMEPKIKLASFDLLKKYVGASPRRELPGESYRTTDRVRETAASIFREENVELERKDAELAEQYQSTIGAMTVTFRGEERTIQQMSRFLEETDRGVREQAWRMTQDRLLADSEKLDLIYDGMVRLRDQAARNAGFDNYVRYAFRQRNRFDYTPEDCSRFHDAVEKYFVPLSGKIDEERLEKMGVDRLMPWDIHVDPEGRPPLSPFNDVSELVAGCSKVIGRVDPQLSGFFSRMVELELLDLESRKGKAPGGYQDDFSEVRLPFIFMNAAKRDNDVRTLLHESGHSSHSFLMRAAGLPFYNSGQNLPTEFAEVASTSMELMGGEHLEGVFYGPDEAKRSNKTEVIQSIKLFTWVATIDAYQHWVYTHPSHTHEERSEAWARIFRRFSGMESYEGFDRSLRFRWQRQLHLFQFPLYYIEYGIANLGALGIWLRYRGDPTGAIEAYKGALSLGGSRPLPELFRAAGVAWDLGAGNIEGYSKELASVLKTFT